MAVMDSGNERRVCNRCSSSWPRRDCAVGKFIPSEWVGRSEFCRLHGNALSTLNRHLKKHSMQQRHTVSEGVGRSCLVEIELPAAVVSVAGVEPQGLLTVLLSNGRRAAP